jgi:hypothetical protein
MYNYDANSVEYREAYRQAERRVKAKLGFYWHFSVYLIINGLLIGIYLLTTLAAGFYYPWFVWPMAGWGIGILFHFLGVFVFPGDNSGNIRRKMIEEELRKMGATVPPPGTGYTPPPGPGQNFTDRN